MGESGEGSPRARRNHRACSILEAVTLVNRNGVCYNDRVMTRSLTILFEDEHLVAVGKGPDELVVPSQWTSKDQPLIGRLQAQYAGRIWAVHRLDRETSGVVLFARSHEALQSLNDQFRHHRIRKTYHAVVQGIIRQPNGVLTDRVARGSKWTAARVAKPGEGQYARTEYTVLERFGGYTLVEARPLTGRFHQLRVHFCQLGHPLAYDPIYNPGAAFILRRVQLQASSVWLTHPCSGQPLEIGCPWPDDFTRAIQQLRKN